MLLVDDTEQGLVGRLITALTRRSIFCAS